MRKIVAIIDCDLCHHPFEQVAIVTGEKYEIGLSVNDLEYNAEQSGWHCYHGKHHCVNCIMQILYPEELVPQ